MASVFEETGDGEHRTVGIITLEDVLEELLQEEILDEHDHLRAHKLKHHMQPPGSQGSAALVTSSKSYVFSDCTFDFKVTRVADMSTTRSNPRQLHWHPYHRCQ